MTFYLQSMCLWSRPTTPILVNKLYRSRTESVCIIFTKTKEVFALNAKAKKKQKRIFVRDGRFLYSEWMLAFCFFCTRASVSIPDVRPCVYYAVTIMRLLSLEKKMKKFSPLNAKYDGFVFLCLSFYHHFQLCRTTILGIGFRFVLVHIINAPNFDILRCYHI